MKQNVFIFRTQLLRYSETFILSQAEALGAFEPIYVGLRAVAGLVIPEHRRVLLAGDGLFGRLKRAHIWLTGVPPRGIDRLRKYSPSLIHAHFGVDAILAHSVSRKMGIPLVVTFHGYDATVSENALRRGYLEERVYAARRSSLIAADRLICVSDFIKQCVVRIGFPEEKTQVHYIGVNTREYTPDPSVARSPVVLFVGRLVAKKGCEYLIRAMETVQATMPQADLVVIGDGPLRTKLEQYALEHSVRCRFLGAQPPDIVRSWMNRAMVFCVPSIVADNGDAEGFGIVFAEAQSMGLPVASFATGGVPEAVKHGETGLLAAEKDCDALASNILELIRNSSMWLRFSDAARQRARSLFDLEKQTALLEQIYEDVLADRQAQGSVPGLPEPAVACAPS